MNKILGILSLSLALGLSACGGSDSAPQSGAQSITILGNSLAVQDPNPNVGWDHTSGMAATDAAHDYAHIVAQKTGLSLDVRNVVDLERDPLDTYFSVIPAATSKLNAHSAVVVQLGDELNVDKRADFVSAYSKLLDATNGVEILLCVSTWWADSVTDASIKAACSSHGGTYVYIGDIYPTRLDVIGSGESVAVATRPHDPSMALIAQRIQGALQ